MTSDLLMNGAFDSTPIGAMWTATPANPMYPIITSDGVTPQSTPDKAWMGSVVSATDDMYEAVTVPASTTMLVVTGYYQIKTAETGTTANDTAKVELTDSNGMSLESALGLDNTQAGTTWVSFSHTFTTNVANQMVRLHFTTTNNSTKATSFYFDTVALQATSCQ